MLRHFLATLEGTWEFVVLIESSFPLGAPLSLFVTYCTLFSFLLLLGVLHARLQA